MLDATKKDTSSRAKERPQKVDQRGKITFRIKPPICQNNSEGSNKPVLTRIQRSHKTEIELFLSVS